MYWKTKRCDKWRVLGGFRSGSSAEVDLLPENRRKRKKWAWRRRAEDERRGIAAWLRGEWKSSFAEMKRCPGDITIRMSNATVHGTGRSEGQAGTTLPQSSKLQRTQTDDATHQHIQRHGESEGEQGNAHCNCNTGLSAMRWFVMLSLENQQTIENEYAINIKF